jgi:V8-like Glu-specific endopeptidase
MISRIMAVLMVVFASVAQADTNQPTRKLMSADEARDWQAVGRVNLPNGGFCTGALIAPNLVLTAAHCVHDPYTNARLNPADVTFAAGWRQGRASAHRKARRVVVHPTYVHNGKAEFENVGNDIAIVELAHSIRNTAIMPFDRSARPVIGTKVQVVSYAHDRAEMPSIEEPCEILGKSMAVFVLSCHASFGASGAPIFVLENGQPRIASVISAKATWKEQDVALGTSLGTPLEELMAQLQSDNGVLKSKRVSQKSLSEQLGRKPKSLFLKN